MGIHGIHGDSRKALGFKHILVKSAKLKLLNDLKWFFVLVFRRD